MGWPRCLSVLEAAGPRAVCVAVAGQRKGGDHFGAVGNVVGGDRVASAGPYVASIEGRLAIVLRVL